LLTIWCEAPATPSASVVSGEPHSSGFTAGARQIVSKLNSYGLRPEAKAHLAIAARSNGAIAG